MYINVIYGMILCALCTPITRSVVCRIRYLCGVVCRRCGIFSFRFRNFTPLPRPGVTRVYYIRMGRTTFLRTFRRFRPHASHTNVRFSRDQRRTGEIIRNRYYLLAIRSTRTGYTQRENASGTIPCKSLAHVIAWISPGHFENATRRTVRFRTCRC